jgi:hypothetical protein
MDKIKEKATTSIDSTPQQIVATETAGIPQATAGALPSVATMKKTTQRIRRAAEAPPARPTSLAELNIQPPYTATLSNQSFLLWDSGAGDRNRILMFSTERNLELLASRDSHWMADGTFKTAPPLFTQLLTIHAIIFNTVVPLVYALLPNKTKETYKRLLEQLNRLKPSLKPASVMTDFEPALFGAFAEIYEGIRSRGCFFHFGQCLWRKIQQNPDLQKKYTDDKDPDFSLKLRQLMALAFVPEADVIDKFEELMASPFFIENEDLLRPFTDYFEDTWIGRLSRRGRRPPEFPLALWNQYLGTLEDLPKTNNSVEGWHNSFSSLLSANHPTIWKFIDALKKEQSLNELKIVQFIAGQAPPLGRRNYRDQAERVMNIVMQYGSWDMESYLIGIAQNFELQVIS